MGNPCSEYLRLAQLAEAARRTNDHTAHQAVRRKMQEIARRHPTCLGVWFLKPRSSKDLILVEPDTGRPLRGSDGKPIISAWRFVEWIDGKPVPIPDTSKNRSIAPVRTCRVMVDTGGGRFEQVHDHHGPVTIESFRDLKIERRDLGHLGFADLPLATIPHNRRPMHHGKASQALCLKLAEEVAFAIDGVEKLLDLFVENEREWFSQKLRLILKDNIDSRVRRGMHRSTDSVDNTISIFPDGIKMDHREMLVTLARIFHYVPVRMENLVISVIPGGVTATIVPTKASPLTDLVYVGQPISGMRFDFPIDTPIIPSLGAVKDAIKSFVSLSEDEAKTDLALRPYYEFGGAFKTLVFDAIPPFAVLTALAAYGKGKDTWEVTLHLVGSLLAPALAFKTMRDLATLRSLALANAKNHHISPENFTAVFEATMKVFLDKIFDEITALLVETYRVCRTAPVTGGIADQVVP